TAERTRSLPILVLTAIVGIVLPLLIRTGQAIGLPDLGGAGLAVPFGGAVAFAGAWVVGPGQGKFNRDQAVHFVPGRQPVLQMAGVMLLAVSFMAISGPKFGTLYGLAAATLAAAASGALRFGKIDTDLTIAGAI